MIVYYIGGERMEQDYHLPKCRRKYVYLFELDSIRKTNEEIIAGQDALYNEIVGNGNIVVLTFNQFIDSRGFFSLLSNHEYRKCILTLFEKGAIRFSQYNDIKTLSQYWLNAMEDGKKFIYSAIPLKYTQSKLVAILRRSLMYSDLSEIYSYTKEGWNRTAEELDELFPNEDLSMAQMQNVVRQLYFLLSVTLQLSVMKDIYVPAKERQQEFEFYPMLNKIFMLDSPDDVLWKKAINKIKSLEAYKRKTPSNNRSDYLRELSKINQEEFWKENSTIQYAMDIINNCYNYVCELSIRNVSKHYDIEELKHQEMGMPTFREDFFTRLNQQNKFTSFNQYQYTDTNQLLPFKKIALLPNFSYAVRIVSYSEYKDVNLQEPVPLYEYEMEKLGRIHKHETIKSILKVFLSTVVCIIFFTVFNMLISNIEEDISEIVKWENIRLISLEDCIVLYTVELLTDKISKVCPFILPLSEALRNGMRLFLDFFKTVFRGKRENYYNKCNLDVKRKRGIFFRNTKE